MRIAGSAGEIEQRRRRALTLLDEKRTLHEVARLVGCSASSVMRWRNARRRAGEKGLKVRSSPGRPRKLTDAQSRRLTRVLMKGSQAQGYASELWTTSRIAAVIEDLFSVRYHPNHVARLMHRLGWSHQKPARRALERDERAIEQWKTRRWPAVKKTLRGWVPTSSS